jgi:hypothetical protein
MFVFDVATAPAQALQPDPDRAMPPRIGRFLGLLRTLVVYGRNLADRLRQHSAAPHLLPCFAFVARTFATTDPLHHLSAESAGPIPITGPPIFPA